MRCVLPNRSVVLGDFRAPATTVTISPARSRTMVTGRPGAVATRRWKSSKPRTPKPSTETTRSPGQQARLGGHAARHDLADDRRDRVAAIAEQQRVEDEEGEDDIGDRPGSHDGDALPDVLVDEQVLALLGSAARDPHPDRACWRRSCRRRSGHSRPAESPRVRQRVPCRSLKPISSGPKPIEKVWMAMPFQRATR